jgi:uncharacterized protein YaiE (UPF0345 family)
MISKLISTALASLALAGTLVAKEKKPNLEKTFESLHQHFGTKNPDKATVVSGPVAVKMLRGESPGKCWQVQLGDARFKLTIEDKLDLKVQDCLARLEKLPPSYRKAFVIVSEGKKDGIAFYEDLEGASAHGSHDYLNLVKDADALVIAHECGHVLEQRVTSTQPKTLHQWKAAIQADRISVSDYGDEVAHEDLAEFSYVYACCLDGGKLTELKALSPRRFSQGEGILKAAEPIKVP